MPSSDILVGLSQAWSAENVSKVIFGSAVVTTVINVTWFVISKCLRALVRLSRRSIIRHTVVLGEVSRWQFENTLKPISRFYCLLIRYGKDSYIEKLASDDEREEGRLRLKLIPVDVEFDTDGNVFFLLKLPVHKRLGTQFKCFAVVEKMDEIKKVIAILKSCKHVKDVKQSESQHRNRIYFLLDQFADVESIDNIKNNFVYAQ
jgi:hypothetical protein